jgi:hypothetical protein
MGIATSRTSSGKAIIVFPVPQVIGHRSQQQRVLSINYLKVIGYHSQPEEMPAIN